jgi:hypothetical protein
MIDLGIFDSDLKEQFYVSDKIRGARDNIQRVPLGKDLHRILIAKRSHQRGLTHLLLH